MLLHCIFQGKFLNTEIHGTWWLLLFNPLAVQLDIYSLAHHLHKSEYFMNQEG